MADNISSGVPPVPLAGDSSAGSPSPGGEPVPMQQDPTQPASPTPGMDSTSPTPTDTSFGAGATSPTPVQSAAPTPMETPGQAAEIPAGSAQTPAGTDVYGQQAPIGPTTPPIPPTSQVPGMGTAIPTAPVKKRSLALPCCIGVVLVIIVAIVGLSVYAYTSGAEIPIISDIVEQISGFIKDPKEQAKEASEQVASTVLGAMMPLIAKDEGLASSLASTSVSKDYMKGQIENYQDIESLRYDIDINMLTEGGEEDDIYTSTDMDMTMSMIGAFDMKEEGNEKFDADLSLSLSGSGMEYDFEGELRSIGNKSFMKIDVYPYSMKEQIGTLEGKWVDLGSDDVDATQDYIASTETEESEITEEDIDKLMELISDEAFLKNAEFLEDENIEGNNCQCVKLYWNKDEIKELMKRYAEIYGEEYNEEDVNESLEGMDYIETAACIGKDTQMVHKFILKVEGADPDTGATSKIEISLKLWDYGADMGIVEPEDVYDLEELLYQSIDQSSYYEYKGTREDFDMNTYYDVIGK